MRATIRRRSYYEFNKFKEFEILRTYFEKKRER
jgi:hypothetical protein